MDSINQTLVEETVMLFVRMILPALANSSHYAEFPVAVA